MLIFYTTFIDEEKDKTKFERIYEKYHRSMLWAAHNILRDQMMAEDAVHSSFLKVMKCLDKIDIENESQTKRYVLKITKNTALDVIRKRKKDKITGIAFDDLEEWQMPKDKRTDVEFEQATEENAIILAIKSMPELYRDIFILKYSDGYENHEIAKILGISEENVRQRISRGKKMLEQILEERGISVR